VSAAVVAPRHLQQQFLNLIQAAQPVARDGIGQARAQHDELVLPLALRRPHGTPHGAVESAQLALGARIHVTHAAHDGVCLVVQVQAVADQLLQLDFRRAFGTAAIEAAAVASVSAITTAAITTAAVAAGTVAAWPVAARTIAARTITARPNPARSPLRATTFPRRTAFLFLLLL